MLLKKPRSGKRILVEIDNTFLSPHFNRLDVKKPGTDTRIMVNPDFLEPINPEDMKVLEILYG